MGKFGENFDEARPKTRQIAIGELLEGSCLPQVPLKKCLVCGLFQWTRVLIVRTCNLYLYGQGGHGQRKGGVRQS